MPPLHFRWTLILPLVTALSFSATLHAASPSPKAASSTATTQAANDSDTPIGELQEFTPEHTFKKTSRQIVEQLKRKHYSQLELDDSLSIRIFDEYLESLDPSRQYFTQRDINQFKRYRTVLDDALARGDLQIPFEIYNVYQSRVAARLEWIMNQLENNQTALLKPQEDTLELDREEAPWSGSTSELDELWDKRLRNNVLTLKLTGEPDDKIFETLNKRYANQMRRLSQATSDDIFTNYMNSFVRVYDPHTQYLSPEILENFRINMRLELEGIGAVLQTENDYTKIVRLVHGGPAEKSKQLAPADRIIGVAQGKDGDMQDVIGWRLKDVVKLIRGPKDSVVQLKVIPANATSDSQTRTLKITRAKVQLEDRAAQKKLLTLNHEGHEYRIGVIEIPAFYADMQGLARGVKGARSTSRDVATLIKQLQNDKVHGIVIDLRDNGGGALSEVNSLVSLFIDQGPIVQIKHVNGTVDFLEDDVPGTLYDGPLAVLVNRLSASASEIFAGAIQDYGRGVVIGGRTFGKGTVQSLQRRNQGELKLTLAKFYRISGQSNQHVGIMPDITFPSLIDPDDIGESALDNALPFDAIAPARYKPVAQLKPAIDYAMEQHETRTITDADFKYLRHKRDLLDHYRDQTEVSLNEKARLEEKVEREKERLAIENTRRQAQGDKPFKDFAAFEKWQEQEQAELDNGDDHPNKDYALRESGHILIDMVNYPHTQVADTPLRAR